MKQLFLSAFLLLSLASCSTVKKVFKEESYHPTVSLEHRPMAAQRIAPRTGHDGFLVNQICKEFNGKGECVGVTSFERYDLKDEAIRRNLNQFGFACRVAGKRYRISLDRPGLIRTEGGCLKYRKKLVSRKKVCETYGEVKSDFLDIVEKYQYLIAGATECRAGY